MIRIGLIGDYDESVTAHRAIPLAIESAANELGLRFEIRWCPTDSINVPELHEFHGLWCVPASPYRDMEGALRAIRFARKSGRPFLGTCGGFQHAIIEYARNVLGWTKAAHAECTPGSESLVITPLHCALVEQCENVHFAEGSKLRYAYGTDNSSEGYHCRYGLNPAIKDALTEDALRIAAIDSGGEVRGLELAGHPFFVLTLFQPERAALQGVVPPIVRSFLRECARFQFPS